MGPWGLPVTEMTGGNSSTLVECRISHVWDCLILPAYLKDFTFACCLCSSYPSISTSYPSPLHPSPTPVFWLHAWSFPLVKTPSLILCNSPSDLPDLPGQPVLLTRAANTGQVMSKLHFPKFKRETSNIVLFLNAEADKLNQKLFGAGGRMGDERWERRKEEAGKSHPSTLELSLALFPF